MHSKMQSLAEMTKSVQETSSRVSAEKDRDLEQLRLR